MTKKADHKKLAEALQKMGTGGDTLLIHVNPWEAALLDKITDGATVNKKTGLLAFDDDSGDGSGTGDGDGDGDDSAGDDDDDGGYGNDGNDDGGWGNSGVDMSSVADTSDIGGPGGGFGQESDTLEQHGTVGAGPTGYGGGYESYGYPDNFGPSSYVGYNGIGANSWSDLLSGGNVANAVGYGVDRFMDNPVANFTDLAIGLAAPPAYAASAMLNNIGNKAGFSIGHGVQSAVNTLTSPTDFSVAMGAGPNSRSLESMPTSGVPDGLVGGPGNDDIASSQGSEMSVNERPQTSSERATALPAGGFGTFKPKRFNVSQFSGVGDLLGSPSPVTMDGITNPMAVALSQYKGLGNG